MELLQLHKNGNDKILLQKSAGLCEFTTIDKSIYPTFLEYSNFPKSGECPIPKVISTLIESVFFFYFKSSFIHLSGKLYVNEL